MKRKALFIILIVGLVSVKNISGQAVNTNGKTRHIRYKPETSQLIIKDTTINDAVRLKIRHYTLMDSYANDYGDVTPDSIETRYRDYAVDVTVMNKGKVVLNRTFVKSDFISDQKYWKNLTLTRVWLESVDNNNSKLILRVAIGLPDLYKPVVAYLNIGFNGEVETKLR